MWLDANCSTYAIYSTIQPQCMVMHKHFNVLYILEIFPSIDSNSNDSRIRNVIQIRWQIEIEVKMSDSTDAIKWPPEGICINKWLE